jgi:ABC-2 type transport system permease protein
MLRQVLYVARKDLKFLFRAKETLLWVFAMPILFFWFIGTVTGGGGGLLGKGSLALWAGEEPGFLGEQLELRLTEQDFVLSRPDSLPAFRSAHRRLELPASFSDSLLAGRPVELVYGDESSGNYGAFRKLKLMRAVYGLLADIVVSGGENGAAPDSAAIADLNARPRALSLLVESGGAYREPPGGFSQSVPGIMVMFTILIMGTSGAVFLVIERRQGLLKRLAYAPISPLGVVLGKWLSKLVLGLVQIGFAMLSGSLLFGMDWGANLPAVILLMIVYGAMIAGLGLLLGSLARTEGQAAAIGVVAANLLGALGGCWWPIEVTPPFMQKLALFLPTGWAMDALHKLVHFGASPATVLPHLLGMGLLALLLIFLTARVFRYE